MLRGAPISVQERKELNLRAGRLFENCGIEMVYDDYDEIRYYGFVGYADYYLKQCWDEFELKNKAEVKIYKQLLAIDSKLGTTGSEQLLWCLSYSFRKDLIEVRIHF